MRLASRGLRDFDAGIEEIVDAEAAATLRRQSRRVTVKALLLAAALTLFVVALPL